MAEVKDEIGSSISLRAQDTAPADLSLKIGCSTSWELRDGEKSA